MTTAEKVSATTRIRDAEEAVARAQSALDKAQSGLHAAEKVAETAEDMKSHPVRTTLIGLMVLAIITAIVAVLRDRES